MLIFRQASFYFALIGVAAALLLTCAALALNAQATPQQDKMKACNADAKTKNLAGDERKAFMKECLSAK